MTLRLNSPVGGSPAIYYWPLPKKAGYDGITEILETIKWGCKDIPDVEAALKRNIMKDVDVTSFESMRALCRKYNKAIDSVLALEKGTQKFVDRLNQLASIDLLRHIIQQTYNAAVTDAEELNKYQAFSPDVYGETSFDLICQMVQQIKLTKDDVFLDLGSGVGQVVLQIAATGMCKVSVGIERAEVPAKFAEAMDEHFQFWMQWYGKKCGQYKLIKGDFFDEVYRQIIPESTVIFVNNFAFGPSVDHKLKERFGELKHGTKIISSKSFCPLNFRISDRNLSDVGTIMNVTEILPVKSSVSWTDRPVSFYLHIIDRTKLENYFRQKREQRDVVKICDNRLNGNGLCNGVERSRKRKNPRKLPRGNSSPSTISFASKPEVQNHLERMLDAFRFEYMQMVDKMADPLFKMSLEKQIEDEIRKSCYLKKRISEVNQEIESIILLMKSYIS